MLAGRFVSFHWRRTVRPQVWGVLGMAALAVAAWSIAEPMGWATIGVSCLIMERRVRA
jgi:drug/metabolite transporter superfamily protein YnfA